MLKKIVFILVVIFIYCSGFRFVQASVIINEVKYSPTTGQWVEIYNDTDNDIDITTYRILDSGAATNGHAIAAVDGGSNFIPKHSFGVVAKVPSDLGTVSYPLFKSSLNIKVSADTVILRNENEENISMVSIDGAAIDGNSFQLIDGTWKVGIPTPGVQNNSSPSVALQSSGGVALNPSTSTQGTTEVKTKIVEIPKIKTKIISKNLAFVNLPIELQANNTGYSGETLYYGKNFWNFGDGDSKEQINKFDRFTHTYFYPGEYSVSLEYYGNQYSEIPDATNKLIIDVVPLDVSISRVGDDKDFFIEISNGSDYEVDISKWILSSSSRTFILPKNTTMSAKGAITLSPKITGFNIGDESSLKLLTGTGSLIYEYKSISNIVPEIKNNISRTEKTNFVPQKILNKTENDPTITANNLEAEASTSREGNSYWFFIGFAILLVASSGAVYFIRHKKVASIPGDDFQILDE